MTSAPSTVNFDHLLADGVALKGFQTVGVAYALAAGRTFIADEMGLGKTIQAITVIAAQRRIQPGAKSVVVCPASLKANWQREIAKFAAETLRVQVASGRTPKVDPAADVIIVNYDILGAWQPALTGFSVLVLDESHYAKNPKAQRTTAALALAKKVPASGKVLLLTGTPLLNRPIELLPQLQILDVLDRIAPSRKGDHEFAFKFQFCRNEQSKRETGKYTWDGAVDTERLNGLLRKVGYVRRLRSEVLGMHDTVRVPQVLSLNGSLVDYRKAEADLISFLRSAKGEWAANAARRAEALVKLNTLRTLVGLAKVEAAIEWIDNFLTSNPGESLVVFATHVEVQKALVAHFGCPAILGGQSAEATESAKAIFQAKGSPIIVCSLKAAREGHTLTAASNVLFVEQGWTPGEMQQAEDRINRIGQNADYCIATTLLGDDTIDEYVAGLIERKRAVFEAVANGTEAADDESGVAMALLSHLAGE